MSKRTEKYEIIDKMRVNMKNTGMNEKDIKYKFVCCDNKEKYETDRHKIEKIIRDKMGKKLVMIYGDTVPTLTLLDILHNKHVICISDVSALIMHLKDLKIVMFFIKKTESLKKEFDMNKLDYDNWLGLSVTDADDQENKNVPKLTVKTLHLMTIDNETMDFIINDIMAVEQSLDGW